MLTRPEMDEANSHEAEAEIEAKIALIIFFSQILRFDPIFYKKTKFSVDFRRDFENFGSKQTLTWELY